MIENLTYIIIFFYSFSGFSQVDNTIKIDTKSYQIDSDLGTRINKKNFQIDSLQIKSKVFELRISSEIKFQKSKNIIEVDIYLDNNKIMLIRVTEQSATLKSYAEAKKISIIYFKDGIKIDEKVRIVIPGELHGIGIPQDSDEEFGYEKNLTTLYLEKLSNQIIEKIAE